MAGCFLVSAAVILLTLGFDIIVTAVDCVMRYHARSKAIRCDALPISLQVSGKGEPLVRKHSASFN